MKYMIEYKVRHAGLTHEQNMANEQALLAAFGKWKPEEGLNVRAFVGKLGSAAGYVLVEADDPRIVRNCQGGSPGTAAPVMAGLVPAIHAVELLQTFRTWQ